MPSSNSETIPIVIGLARLLAPTRVLDVGAGFGKYGVLFREYLELLFAQETSDWTKDDAQRRRKVRIDAVEGFRAYIGPLHEWVYDEIFVQEVQDFLKGDWEYDVIFMGDVLEHFEKRFALEELLPRLVSRSRMGVLIVTPLKCDDQGVVFGNRLEIHRSLWRPKDFHRIARFVYVGRRNSNLIVFLTEHKECYRLARGNPIRRKLRLFKRALLDSW